MMTTGNQVLLMKKQIMMTTMTNSRRLTKTKIMEKKREVMRTYLMNRIEEESVNQKLTVRTYKNDPAPLLTMVLMPKKLVIKLTRDFCHFVKNDTLLIIKS